ncbi:hypothetical protein [Pseudomonas sp.]|uniref:hypothetical protein n=1 Tax=Pseudomonas sp. TaxID=306 RepID=UPI00272FC3C3|nr:hypothetical protein [Pseudomonas sp.]MDP2243549.1 hypothetical protein [Pseudomonas sp.]
MKDAIFDAAEERRHQILLSVRQVVASYAVYWHKLAVDSTIFIVTGSIALAGFALSTTSPTRTMLISVCIILALLGWAGAYLTRLIQQKTEEHQAILIRLDNIHGLLEPGLYLPNESVYPQHWRDTGEKHIIDPIFRFCFLLLGVLPFVLGSLILVSGWT